MKLDLDERQGRLYPPDTLIEYFTNLIMGTRAHFLAMQTRWAPLLTGIQSLPEMADKLRDAVYQALDEMADADVQKVLQAGSESDGR